MELTGEKRKKEERQEGQIRKRKRTERKTREREEEEVFERKGREKWSHAFVCSLLTPGQSNIT
jgi:hypothetical protein